LRNFEYTLGVVAMQCTEAAGATAPTHSGPRPAALQRWELYRLLSDTTRLHLLALGSAHELAVSELAELLRQGQPKVSRHAAALRDAGLLCGRKQGNWLLLRLAPRVDDDPVVADALETGLALCTADGTLERVADVVARRDAATREFFARDGHALQSGPPAELAAYLRLIGQLIGDRRLAVDAGTGDGALLEVLAPLFDQVIAVDRSSAQLELARQRAAQRQFRNIRFVCGEIDGDELQRALSSVGRSGKAARSGPHHARKRPSPRPRAGTSDAVFAARVLHHAPVPAQSMRALAALAREPAAGRPGGAVLLLDYQSHGDEALREQQADLWLGFDPAELRTMAEQAGLVDISHGTLPAAWCGDGADSHLGWHWLAARRGAALPPATRTSRRPTRKTTAAKRGRTERTKR